MLSEGACICSLYRRKILGSSPCSLTEIVFIRVTFFFKSKPWKHDPNMRVTKLVAADLINLFLHPIPALPPK